MKLLVLGATGATGQQIVAQALEQGHDVTALVRDPGKLTARSERLRLITGSVPDQPQVVAEAVRGQDAVVSALGRGQSLKPGALIARSAPVIVSAMERQGVRRLIFVSALGVGATAGHLPIAMRVFQRLLLRAIAADKEIGEQVIRASNLDWTLVHPSGLTNRPKTGRYRSGEHLDLRGFPTIARADVAAFVLTQLRDPTYVRKTVTVSS
jgi:putative NADH-flavin reductase